MPVQSRLRRFNGQIHSAEELRRTASAVEKHNYSVMLSDSLDRYFK